MTIAVLVCLSLLLMVAAFIYLTHKDFVGETIGSKITSAVKNNKKVLIYLCCALAFMIGLSVALFLIYKTNTLIANMKVITLLGILVTVTVPDIKEHIIPNKVILAGVVLRVCYAVVELITLGSGYFAILKGDLFSLGLVAVLFLLGVLVIKNGIGMGDIKLILVMGLFQGVTGVISSLFFSLLVSFFVAIAMLIMKKKSRKDAIAFAPSVLVGTAVSMFLTGM